MTNKEKMLHMVLDNKWLQEHYDYEFSEDEDMNSAITSENVVVSAVAHIIKELVIGQEGSISDTEKRRVYSIVYNYIYDNYLV